MKKFYLFLILIGLWSSTIAQNTFEKIIDSPNNTANNAMASCMNENNEFFVLTQSPFAVVKISSQGDTIWHKPLVSDTYFQATCISVGADNGIVVGGHSNEKLTVQKIGDDGNKLWEKQLSTGTFNSCTNIKAIANEAYILVGNLNSQASLIKLNLSGEEIWTKSNLQLNNTNYNLNPNLIAVANDGYIMGGSCSFEVQESFFIKYDLNGDKVWELLLGENNNSNLKNISLCANGDILFAGTKTPQDVADNIKWFGRINSSGEIVWQKNDSEYAMNIVSDILEDENGDILIVGSVYDNSYSTDQYMAKFNSEGNQLWNRKFGGNNPGDLINCFISGTNIYGIGNEYADYTWDNNLNSNRIYLLKTNFDGHVNDLDLWSNEDDYCENMMNQVRTFAFLSSYNWSTPNQNSSSDGYGHMVEKAGEYSVQATDKNGNTRQSNIITIHSKPTPNISFNGETSICKGESINLSTAQEYTTYEWFKSDKDKYSELISVGTNREYTANETANYYVKVTDANGCQNSIEYHSEREPITVIDPKVDILSVNKRTINAIIGDGTELNEEASTSLPAPWGTYRKSSHQQYLIRADELLAMGLEANSELKELAFFLEKANNSGTSIAEFKIRIASTSKTELNGLDNSESYTDLNDTWVYENDEIGTPSTGWKNFNISFYDYSANNQKGYLWDGTSNLIIDVSYYNNQETSYSKKHSIFRMTEMGYKASWVRFATTNIKYEYSGGVFSTLRPNIRFKAELPSGEDLIVGCGKDVTLKLDKDYAEINWSTGSTDDQITVTDVGTISVTTTDDYGCVATDSKEIKLSSFDIEIMADKSTFCEGDQANLSIQGDYPFLQWNTGETTSSILTNESGKYSIEVRNEDQCVANDTVEISEIKKPKIFENRNNTICHTGDNIISYNYLGVFNGNHYYLYGESNGMSFNDAQQRANELGGKILTIESNEESEFVRRDLGNIMNHIWLGISDREEEGEWKTITGDIISHDNWEYEQPRNDTEWEHLDYAVMNYGDGSWTTQQQYSGYALIVEFNYQAPKAVICDSTIFVAAGNFTSYTWNKGGVAIGTNTSLTVKEPGNYTVTGVSEVGCSLTSDPVEISKVSTSPVIDGIVSGSLCSGDGNATIDAGAGFDTYLWNTGETSQSITVADQDYYSVKVTNEDACASTEEFGLRCKIFVSPNGDDSNRGTVADPFLTITQAIGFAQPGDTIIVKDGTYIENISFSKNIILGSEFLIDGNKDHITNTIIDGNEQGSVINITFPAVINPDYTAEIESPVGIIGFTLQNGSSNNQYGSNSGGGIYSNGWYGNSFQMRHLILNSNNAEQGGGIYCAEGLYTLEDIVIENSIANQGSGLYISNIYEKSVLNNITIRKTTGSAALFIQSQNNLIFNNFKIIDSNSEGCNINSYNNSRLDFNNILIVKNQQSGMSINSGNVNVINGTIANNSSGVLFGSEQVKLNILNSIICDNKETQINPGWNEFGKRELNIAHSVLQGGIETVNNYYQNENNKVIVKAGEGIIGSNISFKDTLNNDYRLLASSPAIGSGVKEITFDDLTLAAPTVDVYGTVRPNPSGSNPDLGAIEHEKGVGDFYIELSECGGDITLDVFNKEVESILWTGPDEFTSSDKNLVNVKEGVYNVSVTDTEGTIISSSIEVKDPLRFTTKHKHVCAAVNEKSGRLELFISGGKPIDDMAMSFFYKLTLSGTDYLESRNANVYQNAEGTGTYIDGAMFDNLKAGQYVLKVADSSCELVEEIEILSREGQYYFVSTEGDDENIGSEELPLSLIQTAIDRACDLDTIIVEPGIYTENIRFNGKNVTLASKYILDKDASFVSQTIIDGNEKGSVVSFQNGESRDAKLIGFTIQNGRSEMNEYDNGGGITIRNSNPTLKRLIVKNNRARRGGGIFIADCKASVTDVHFENNIATDEGDALSIQNIYVDAVLDDLTFKGESNAHSTVNMNQYSNIEIGHWSFENFGNTALVVQGNWDGNTQVVFNNLELKGGQQGVRINQGNYSFKNLVASGILTEVINLENNAKVALINSTVVNNNQAVRMSYGDSKLLVLNSILRNNSSQEISYETGMDGYGKSIEIHHSNIKNGQKGIVGEESNLQNFTYGDSNLDRDEYFVDAENGDFHLLDISPSVGAGIASINIFDTDYHMPTTDFGGLARSIPTGSAVDLGAFENESISRKIVRAISCNGGNDGSIEIEMLSGKAPFTYLWDDENTTQDSKVLVNEADRMYHVLVTDTDGKVYKDSAWVTQPDELIALVIDSTNISRQGLADGDATIQATGGNAPYSFYWEGIEKTTPYVNNLEADKLYKINVVDNKACMTQTSVVLKVLPLLEENLCGFSAVDGEIKLNSTDIRAIETDFEGTIWFSTGNELTSYNGKDWDIINANFSYSAIHKDKNGNIWLGADYDNKGLNMFDGRSWHPYKETDGLAGNNVMGIAEDSYGNLWIATDKGVSRFDGEKFSIFTHQDGLSDDHCSSIFVDKDDYVWVSTNSGVSRYKILSKTQGEDWENFQYENNISLGDVRNMTQDTNGDIWMSSSRTGEGQSGIIKFDGNNWNRVETGLNVPSTYISDIFCDTEGDVWVGTHEGLLHYSEGVWQSHIKDVDLPSNYVSAIGEDAFGAIWVGFSNGDNGISKYFNEQWTTLHKANGSNASVQCMALDAEKNLWVGSSNWENSLKKFDGNNWKIFNYEDGFQGSVNDLDTDSELKVWVASDQGVYKYNGTTFDKYDTANGLKSNWIKKLSIDVNDYVWMIYNEEGLTRMKGNEIINYSTEDGLKANAISAIDADSQGNIWIKYENEYQKTISKFDGSNITHYTIEENMGNDFYSLNNIFVDIKDRIWVSSNSHYAILENEEWTYYKLEQHGIDPNQVINTIGEDADGNIWISYFENYWDGYGNTGMLKFNGTDWVSYSEEPGFKGNSITSIQDDAKGRIWYGGIKGLIRYTKCIDEEVLVAVNNGGCSGEGNRSLSITTTGDTAPYQYSINNGESFQDSNIFDNLKAGIYHLIVTNTNGELIADREVVITDPVPLRANVEGFNTTCNGRTDGAALCIPTGGTAPYSFIWDDNSTSTTARVEGLSEDAEYTVTLTDANNCTATASVSVGHDPHLKFTDWSNVSCYGLNDGSATITPIGGKAPFTFKWDDNLQTSDSTISTLIGGKYYHVTVTDANNCTAIDSIKLDAPEEFTVKSQIFNSCDGENTGGIDLIITGGTIPYTYLWSDEEKSTSNRLYKIGAGEYSVIVSDAMDCTAETSATIVEKNTPQTVEITSSHGEYFCPGKSELLATEGFNTYLWSTGEGGNSVNPEHPGEFFVRAYDENLCSATATFDLQTLNTYQHQQLCLVTVNSDNKNEIVWERQKDLGIVSYNIYKEANSISSMELVKNVPIEETSVIVDEESDPSARSHTYAISITDVCGVESQISDIHHTMLLQANQGINGEINLIWNKYEGFEFNTYNIYRGTSVDEMVKIESISNTESKYIDRNPPNVENFYYVLEVENEYTCDISQLKSYNSNYGVSRSNYLGAKSTVTGIDDPDLNVKKLTVFPNPMKIKSRIEFDNPNFSQYCLSVYDMNGRLVLIENDINSNRFELERGDLASGQYIIEIRGENLYRGRLIVE